MDPDYQQEIEELQDHVEGLEKQLAKLEREKAALQEQVDRGVGLAGAGAMVAGGAAVGDAAATLAKYNKLKERYKVRLIPLPDVSWRSSLWLRIEGLGCHLADARGD